MFFSPPILLMYPNLYFFIKEVLGVEPWSFTKYINTFGLLVAIAFVIGAFIISTELKRKESAGLLTAIDEKIIVGKPASLIELILHFFFGFLVGYKILGIFFNAEQVYPQDYIFSSQGSLFGGFLMGILFSGLKYFETRKYATSKPEEKTIKIWPHERVGDITVFAAIAGFIGAKVFDNLENWDRFIQDPIGNLLAPSGLTFYGGLIVASATIILFARRKKINVRHLVDSAAPALMIAYAIGRMGCHFSGDGDWGVFNSAYTVDSENKIVEAVPSDYMNTLQKNPEYARYLIAEFGSLENIPHIAYKGADWLPYWFWAYNFPHNVNEVGVPIAGCDGPYCNQLIPPVFPTTLYEIIACTILFVLLWLVRKKIMIPGRLFAFYLVLNGFERFFIEKIRVNSTYNILGFHPTQAEIISSLLIFSGVALWIKLGSFSTRKS